MHVGSRKIGIAEPEQGLGCGTTSGQFGRTLAPPNPRSLEPLLQLDDGILLDPQLAEQSK
jgi:hypothetical protein